jgi:transcription antitermination factor NusG
LFVTIELQWHEARWCPGVVRLVMDGIVPAKVPDGVIAAIRERERNGLVRLPPRLKPGDPVRILHGPFTGHLALYAGQAARERVMAGVLGSQQRVSLPQTSVEPAST